MRDGPLKIRLQVGKVAVFETGLTRGSQYSKENVESEFAEFVCGGWLAVTLPRSLRGGGGRPTDRKTDSNSVNRLFATKVEENV